MKECGTEGEKGQDLLVEVLVQAPDAEAVKVGGDLQMYEAVGQCRRHLEDRRTIRFAVACRPDEPAVRHPVAAHLAIENQLLGDALHGGADLADHVGVVVVDAGDEADLGLGEIAVLAALRSGDVVAAVREGVGPEQVAEQTGALAVDLVQVLEGLGADHEVRRLAPVGRLVTFAGDGLEARVEAFGDDAIDDGADDDRAEPGGAETVGEGAEVVGLQARPEGRRELGRRGAGGGCGPFNRGAAGRFLWGDYAEKTADCRGREGGIYTEEREADEIGGD